MKKVMSKADQDKWNKRYMELAEFISNWSTCIRDKRQVGAVIVKNNRLMTLGYNGAPSNIQNCRERGYCIRERDNIASGTCMEHCYSICAEQNAIIQAAKLGLSVEGAVMYSTLSPCPNCARAIITSGIEKVYYKHDYTNDFSRSLFKEAGVELIQIKT
ncbi:MAG: dCMP deaminase family protein [Christensenellaceae bacterium]|jgi:dCMP deaminase|nr:dCMP deaminase family protein [Christensenellaceae bacterium]